MHRSDDDSALSMGTATVKTESRVNGYGEINSPKMELDDGSGDSYWGGNNGPNSGTSGGGASMAASSGDQKCCLMDNNRRCSRLAGNASYSKRIQKTVAQRKLKLHMENNARHNYICDYHKNVIQSLRTKRKRKDSDDESGEMDSEIPEVDLFQLQVNTLRRYKKHYKVTSRPGMNKAQLAECLMRHFRTINVVEKEALTFFIYMIKTNKSKLDNPNNENRRDFETD